MPPRKELPLTDEEIRRRYEEGETRYALADACNCSCSVITRRVIAAGGAMRNFNIDVTDKELRKRYEEGESTFHLAEVCGCCQSAIYHAIKRAGGTLNKFKKLPLTNEELRERYEAGENSCALAKICGCSNSVIIYRIRSVGGTIRKRGEVQSLTLLLTNEEIRERYEAGETTVELAEICDCDRSTIRQRICKVGGKIRNMSEAVLLLQNSMDLPLTNGEVRKQYESGKSSVEIAKICGCDSGTIIKRIRDAGGELRRPNIPLTNEELRVKYENGEDTYQLAKLYGCTPQVISSRIRGAGGEIKRNMSGENHPGWKGGIAQVEYCNLFNAPLKVAIRNYFDGECFLDGEPEKNGRALSVHHVNYDKQCGCMASQLCICIPVKARWNAKFNTNRWFWYAYLMSQIFLRNPNYFAYHIPVWGMAELEYNHSYVFEKFRKR